MQLQFIGCGDALGSGGRSNTCFHVTGERVNFLIDCGASSLPTLKRFGVARDAIKASRSIGSVRREARRFFRNAGATLNTTQSSAATTATYSTMGRPVMRTASG